LGSRKRITYIPEWVRVFVLGLVKSLTTGRLYGPIEFFMTVMAIDMIAPEYGKKKLKAYFEDLKNKTEA
jgi:hypothetical protein